MKPTRLILVCAALAGAALSARAADAVWDNTQAARLADADAARSYNAAARACANARDILETNCARLDSLAETHAGYKAMLDDADAALKSLEREAKLLRARFTRNQSLLKTAAANAEALKAVLPLAKARMQTAAAQASAALEEARKNPGERYQDLNYLTNVVAQMNASADALNRVQRQAEKAAISLAVSLPRVEGAQRTLALFDEFYEKAAQTHGKNAEKIGQTQTALKSRDDACLKMLDTLSQSYEAQRAARTRLLATSVRLNAFLLNTLAESPAYKDAVFPALDIEDLLAAVSLSRNARKSAVAGAAMNAGFAGGSFGAFAPQVSRALAKRIGLDLHDGALAAESSDIQAQKSARNTSGLAAIEPPKTARAEILEQAGAFIALAREWERARALVQDILDDTRAAAAAVESDESAAQALLREAMDTFTQAQTLGANLDIFAGALDVAKVQDGVSAAEFGKLAAQASECLKDSDKALTRAAAALSAAQSALKK